MIGAAGRRVRVHEPARVVPGDRDGRDVVQPARARRLGEGDDVAGAVDVRRPVRGFVGGEVVDRAEVQHVVHRGEAAQFDAERVFGQVTGDGYQPVGVRPVLDEGASRPREVSRTSA